MDRRVIALVVVVAIVVLLVAFPSIAQAYARNTALTRCAELESQLRVARTQGGDANVAAQLQVQLEACYGQARDAGAMIDLGAVLVRDCQTAQRQMQLEFAHYRSTEYSDSLKRNNTRSAILRLCEDTAHCYQGAIDRVESVQPAKDIKQIIVSTIADAIARRDCYKNDESGCGRFALSEDHGNDKASQEADRCIEPLTRALDSINTKIATLERAAAVSSPKSTPALPGVGFSV